MVLSLRLREVTEVATDVQVEGLASAEELVAPGATNAIFIRLFHRHGTPFSYVRFMGNRNGAAI